MATEIALIAGQDTLELSMEEFGQKAHFLSCVNRLGVTSPPAVAFSISCLRNLELQDIEHAIQLLSSASELEFGNPRKPLVVSVRSSPVVSLPGLADSVLNLGLNRDIVDQQISLSRSNAFMLDCYALSLGHLLQLFGDTNIAEIRESLGRKPPVQRVIDAYENGLLEQQIDAPNASTEQLLEVARQIERSFWSENTQQYIEEYGVENDGMGLLIQQMAFGNKDRESGTIIGFSRNPNTGENRLYGEVLMKAQGLAVLDHGSNCFPLTQLPKINEPIQSIVRQLEAKFKTLLDFEFTLESGKPYCLQVRPGRSTAQANIKITCDMHREGLIDAKSAAAQVTATEVAEVTQPVIDESKLREEDTLDHGLPTSFGVGSGALATSREHANEFWVAGTPYIYIVAEQQHMDRDLMQNAAAAIVTDAGALSDTAILCRAFGIPCVAMPSATQFNETQATFGWTSVRAGEQVTVDGLNGRILAGVVPCITPQSDDVDQVREWHEQFGTPP